MIFYRTEPGEWFTSERAAAKTGAQYEKVDVPTAKPELLKWLNENEPAKIGHDLVEEEQNGSPEPADDSPSASFGWTDEDQKRIDRRVGSLEEAAQWLRTAPWTDVRCITAIGLERLDDLMATEMKTPA